MFVLPSDIKRPAHNLSAMSRAFFNILQELNLCLYDSSNNIHLIIIPDNSDLTHMKRRKLQPFRMHYLLYSSSPFL